MFYISTNLSFNYLKNITLALRPRILNTNCLACASDSVITGGTCQCGSTNCEDGSTCTSGTTCTPPAGKTVFCKNVDLSKYLWLKTIKTDICP